MVRVAIYSSDAELRGKLEAVLRAHPGARVIGSARDDATLTKLLGGNAADVVVAEAPSDGELADWRQRFASTAFVVLADADAAGLDALAAGALAVLSRSAGAPEISAAIAAVKNGLAALPHSLLATLLAGGAVEIPEPARDGESASLTPRELEVLAAMADGASNKMIARRLGISYHTVKFHVAAILTKLDADSRTEAVARAAHLGLVML